MTRIPPAVPKPGSLSLPRLSRPTNGPPPWRPLTLADITAERVRRAAYDIRRQAGRDGAPAPDGDLGFRFLRTAPSVMEPSAPDDDLVPGDCLAAPTPALPGADPESVLIETWLKTGQPLSGAMS